MSVLAPLVVYRAGVRAGDQSVGLMEGGVIDRRRGLSPAALILAVVVTLCLRAAQLLALWLASRFQQPTGPANPDGTPLEYYVFRPAPGAPDLGSVLMNWDGQWYARIAAMGYPDAATATSANDTWATAFPPAFPFLARWVSAVTGLDFPWAAQVLNTALALVATVLMYLLVRRATGDERVSAAAAVGISLLPSAPVLVAAYSEALALALLLVTLVLIQRQHFGWSALPALGLALTRPIALPLLVVAAVAAASAYRSRPRIRPWDLMGLVLLAAVAAVSPWLWPRLAAWIYGTPRAERFAGVTRTEQVASNFVSGYFGKALNGGGPTVLLLLVLVVIVVLGGLSLLAVRVRWPTESIAWTVPYLGMVLLITPVTPGFFRYLVLAAPLLVVVYAAPWKNPRPGRMVLFSLVVLASLFLQWLWIRYLFIVDPEPALIPWPP